MSELNTSSPPDHAVHQPAAAAAAAGAAAIATPTLEPSSSASASASAPSTTPQATAPRGPRPPPLHQIYKLPAPLRVFPFPTFTASNPLSVVHLAVAWLSHVFFPPAPEPSVVHTAYWDHETRSIIVTDDKSMADLWQQGFYGKGTLSRSEPNWLKREKIRRGAIAGKVSEVATDKRREDRARVKWERARAEQEALEQRRLEEAKLLIEAAAVPPPKPTPASPALLPPVGPLELLALPNCHADLASLRDHARSSGESVDGTDTSMEGSGSSGNDEADSHTTVSSDRPELKRHKSVRFSPNVESAVFQHTDPPSPPRSVSSSSLRVNPVPESHGPARVVEVEPDTRAISTRPVATALPQVTTEDEPPVEAAVVNKEHLQLAPEEAFFLAFALGALRVVDAATQIVLPTRDLLALLRQHSYLPPRISSCLQPDDPFLVHYAVYHHFRSLGFVPRPGIKFGVDCKSTPWSLPLTSCC